MKSADSGFATPSVRPALGSLLPLEIGFAKEDKLNGNCQGKLLDCFYIRDYSVDSVAIRLRIRAFKLLKGNCFFGDGK